MSDPGAGTYELVTARLVLRRLRESDLDALAAIYADPRTMRFLGGPRTRDDARTRLGWMIAAHDEQGFGLWATTLRADGTLVGRCDHEHGPDLRRPRDVPVRPGPAVTPRCYAAERPHRGCTRLARVRLGCRRLDTTARRMGACRSPRTRRPS